MSGVRPDMNDQSKLDRIAEEFTSAIRRGESPSIEQYVAKYPDATELPSLLTSIAMIEGLKEAEAEEPHANSPTLAALDDYTIVREIGRGGMGIVFEAIHQSLGRRVAVKVLGSGLLGDTKHLTRFRREARAAARLRHPHIVSVFGVGQSDQHHYYVMDFIKGMSLKEWLQSITGNRGNELPTRALSVSETESDLQIDSLDESPTSHASYRERQSFLPESSDSPQYFIWVARLVATVCDALQYAHDQGVLHRDIKPANLLIDASGEVWIADFGLAKLAEQQAVTATDDIVGTPQYMPPESYEGKYDLRSETYGVGLLLYELLTLRPAIDGKNPADVMRKAIEGVAGSPRRLNANIPRDLETIVVKSLSNAPTGRYATAGDLRDDLQCFLDDKPISARRVSLLERAIRWSRREPKVAALTCATFASLLALAIVSGVGYMRAAQSLASELQISIEKTRALDSADRQRRRAENNLQIALTAFNKIMRDITQRGIEPDAEFVGEVAETTSPNVTPADAELLQSLLGFFDELSATNSEEMLADSALAGRLAGDIYQRLGNLRRADEVYSDALTRYQKLTRREEDKSESLIAQAEIMNELAIISGVRGARYRADQFYDQSCLLYESFPELQESLEGRFQYARANRIFATLGSRSGLDQLRNLPFPAVAQRTEDDLRACDQAIQLLEALVSVSPKEIRFQAELGRTHRDKAKVLTRTRRRLGAEASVRQSIEIFEEMLANDRHSRAIRYELAKTLSTSEALGINTLLRTVRADELSTSLLEESPTLARYQALKAHTLVALATHQLRFRSNDVAEANLEEALKIYGSLTESMPDLMLYRTKTVTTLESLAELKLAQGDKRAASRYLQQAMRTLGSPGRRFDASRLARSQAQRIRQQLKSLNSGDAP